MSLLFHPPTLLSLPPRSSSKIPIPFPAPNPKSNFPKSRKHPRNPRLTVTPQSLSTPAPETLVDDVGVDDDDDDGSPWEGAVVYRRDGAAAHVEYCTTLQRLGLGRLDSGVSRERAATMGMRAVRRGKGAGGGEGTPVLVSVDVTRRRRGRVKLDGIVKTVITLGCNRCGEPAAECVFSNFTILLTDDPVEEPDKIDIGTIFGDDKSKNFTGSGNGDGEEYEEDVDLDDTLYFPAEEKEIDISKQIRDIVHVEVTINAICDTSCKGVCLRCGTDLNKGRCNCNKEKLQESDYGPLKNLRKQMQQT